MNSTAPKKITSVKDIKKKAPAKEKEKDIIKEDTAAEVAAEEATPAVKYFDAPNYRGFYFTEALNMIGVPSDFAHRQQIARANGIDNYLSLGKDNKELLDKLLAGNLKNPF